MQGEFRLSLSIQVLEVSSWDTPALFASVQVWKGQEHLTTVSLIDLMRVALPESAPLDTIENYAAVAARVAGRALDEVQFTAIEQKTLHHIRNYVEPTNAE